MRITSLKGGHVWGGPVVKCFKTFYLIVNSLQIISLLLFIYFIINSSQINLFCYWYYLFLVNSIENYYFLIFLVSFKTITCLKDVNIQIFSSHLSQLCNKDFVEIFLWPSWKLFWIPSSNEEVDGRKSLKRRQIVEASMKPQRGRCSPRSRITFASFTFSR